LKVWFGFTRGLILINIILFINYFDIIAEMDVRSANNESSEVVDILLPVTFNSTLRPHLIMPTTSDDSLFVTGARAHAISFGAKPVTAISLPFYVGYSL